MTRFGDLMSGNVTPPTPPVPILLVDDEVYDEGGDAEDDVQCG